MYILGYFTPEGDFYTSLAKEKDMTSFVSKFLKDKHSVQEEQLDLILKNEHKEYKFDDSLEEISVFKRIVKKGYIYNSKEMKLLCKFFYKEVQMPDSTSIQDKRENLMLELKETLEKKKFKKKSKKHKNKIKSD